MSGQVFDSIQYRNYYMEFTELMIKKNDPRSAAIVFDSIYKLDTSKVENFWKYAVIAYDKIDNKTMAVELMQKMVEHGNSSFCIKEYAEIRHLSNEILNTEVFKANCDGYKYLIEQPCEFKEFRDSIMKYLIIGSNISRKQDLYIMMGYEEYYPTEGRLYEMSFLERIQYSEIKLDSLVQKHGYPTKEKMVDGWVTFLFGGSLIHSTTVERMENYIEKYNEFLPPKDMAYMIDKIAVQKGIPQTYGTQLNETDETDKGFKLYPVLDIANLNNRRMKVGLNSMEIYLKQYDIDYAEILKADR